MGLALGNIRCWGQQDVLSATAEVRVRPFSPVSSFKIIRAGSDRGSSKRCQPIA